jgi:hypothetical protein
MIYTLGCSFTKWHWPTWSDWLAVYSNNPVTNLAYPGHTNSLIYYTLLDRLSTIDTSDHIYIMWTGNNRVCEWYDQSWVDKKNCAGFFPDNNKQLWFSSGQPYQGLYKSHPDYQPSLSEMIIDNFDIVFKTQILLDKIGCNYHMMFWQNPWLDTREKFTPSYRSLWQTKTQISLQEQRFSENLLKIKPFRNLLENINWSKFAMAPKDITDPSLYSGLWEYTINSKELVSFNHDTDPHPNTLAHHDWLTQHVMPQNPVHRPIAQKIAKITQNIEIPTWSAIDAIRGADITLNKHDIN